MKRLFLVDGSNHAFRVHFALPPMHAADGFPTRALYGFTTMLARLVRTWEPDYVVVSFDVGRTFRNDWYADYKGHRPEMPEDLRQQWEHLPELVEAFGYRALSVPGYEADDVIGTLAKRFASEEVEVTMVTGDKDYCQLVGPHVRILDLMKDEEIGEEQVVDKWGVPADLVADLLGLAGDSSDNIPGVPGIGPKTAAKLLGQHGTLEGVLEAAPGIKGKRGENLRSHADDARLSKRLATIVTDVPIDDTLDDLAPKGLQREQLSALFERWNFGKVAKKLLGEEPAVQVDHYRPVTTEAELDQLVSDLRTAELVAFDTETTSLDALSADLVGMSFAWGSEQAVYVPFGHVDDEGSLAEGQLARERVLAALGPVLADPAVPKIAQNAKYDLEVVQTNGLAFDGLAGDTLLLDYVLAAHERSHKLDTLAQRYLSHRMVSYDEVSEGESRTFAQVPVDEATHYAAEDAHVTWMLHDKLAPQLDAGQKHVYEQIELPLVRVLAGMETAGIRLDTERLSAIRTEIVGRMEAAESEAHDIAGRVFKLNSVKDLRQILFEELGYEPIKKTKTGYSTDHSVLEALAGQQEPDLPAKILEFRSLNKLVGTYLDKLPGYVRDDGRIHASFNQAVAATGRLASSDPNMQNIPIRTAEGRRIRAAFIPADGHVFLAADYSQVELRILAHCSESATLRDGFLRGEDIHRRTASEIFGVPQDDVTPGLRSAAKAINFGLLYGMSAFRLARDLRISRSEAQGYMDSYFGRMPEVEGWIEATRASAHDLGYVTTLFGRRRILPGIHSQQRNERMSAEREAVNTVVQGSAADIIKLAMLRVDEALRERGMASRMLLQVHDELLLEVPEDEIDAARGLLVEAMEGAAELAVPLKVHVAMGHDWEEAHG